MIEDSHGFNRVECQLKMDKNRKYEFIGYIDQYLREVEYITNNINRTIIDSFISAINDVRAGGERGRLFVLGVGGSAANASHSCNDFRKILNIETYTPTDNTAELTARVNDDGWETCFSNWLKVSKVNKKDTVLVFSVGGGSNETSLNIVRAMEFAKERGAKILSVVSRDGGRARELSDVCVLIPPLNNKRITGHAEEWQGIILHLAVNCLAEKDSRELLK